MVWICKNIGQLGGSKYSNVRLSFVDLRWAQLYVSLVPWVVQLFLNNVNSHKTMIEGACCNVLHSMLKSPNQFCAIYLVMLASTKSNLLQITLKIKYI